VLDPVTSSAPCKPLRELAKEAHHAVDLIVKKLLPGGKKAAKDLPIAPVLLAWKKSVEIF
jgi:hypothetical protein